MLNGTDNEVLQEMRNKAWEREATELIKDDETGLVFANPDDHLLWSEIIEIHRIHGDFNSFAKIMADWVTSKQFFE